MAYFQSYVEAPRWAGFGHALVECAHYSGVRLEMRESKGLIKTTFYFTVTGEEENITRFKRLWRKVLDDYDAAPGI